MTNPLVFEVEVDTINLLSVESETSEIFISLAEKDGIVFKTKVDTEVITIDTEIENNEVSVFLGEKDTVIFAVSPGGIDGAPGPQGPPGPTFDGVAWFYGVGPPIPSPIGAKPGDLYLNSQNGTIYKLGD